MIEERTPAEVEEKLDDEAVRIVDIRPAAAFERGHVPGAINIPLGELPRQVEDYEWDRDEVVFVCPIGQSSVQAARLAQSFEGVDEDTTVASMAGGYDEWDGALETGSGNTDG